MFSCIVGCFWFMLRLRIFIFTDFFLYVFLVVEFYFLEDLFLKFWFRKLSTIIMNVIFAFWWKMFFVSVCVYVCGIVWECEWINLNDDVCDIVCAWMISEASVKFELKYKQWNSIWRLIKNFSFKWVKLFQGLWYNS